METNKNQQTPENRPSVPGSANNRDTETGRLDSNPGTSADYASNNPANAGAASAGTSNRPNTDQTSGADAGARSGADLDDAETREITGETDDSYEAAWDDEEDFSDTSEDAEEEDEEEDDLDDEDFADEDDY
ncbi:MAG: hypothetical protein V4714_14125 [Bacteroidota bacterium]